MARVAISRSASSSDKHAGQAGRHVFTHAVADDGVGRDAQRLPEPGQRVLDREQRRLGKQRPGSESPRVVDPPAHRRCPAEHLLQVDALASSPSFFQLAALRIEDVADIDPEVRLENLRAAVDFARRKTGHVS